MMMIMRLIIKNYIAQFSVTYMYTIKCTYNVFLGLV